MMGIFGRLVVRNLQTTYDLKPALFVSLLIPNLMYVFIAAFAYEQIIPPFIINGIQIDYADFLIPGVVLMQVVVLSSLGGAMFWTDKHNGMLEQLYSLPVPRSYYFLSKLCAILISSLASGFAIVLLSLPILSGSLHLEYYSVPLFLLSLTACSIIFGFVSMIIFCYVKTPDNVTVYSRLLTTPLIVLSSVFYPLQYAPRLIRTFGNLNPLTYSADVMRASMFGTITTFEYLESLILLVITLSVVVAAKVVFDRKQLDTL